MENIEIPCSGTLLSNVCPSSSSSSIFSLDFSFVWLQRLKRNNKTPHNGWDCGNRTLFSPEVPWFWISCLILLHLPGILQLNRNSSPIMDLLFVLAHSQISRYPEWGLHQVSVNSPFGWNPSVLIKDRRESIQFPRSVRMSSPFLNAILTAGYRNRVVEHWTTMITGAGGQEVGIAPWFLSPLWLLLTAKSRPPFVLLATIWSTS